MGNYASNRLNFLICYLIILEQTYPPYLSDYFLSIKKTHVSLLCSEGINMIITVLWEWIFLTFS